MHIAEHASPGGISIHALLAESDSTWPTSKKTAPQFLSTLSLRRATAANFGRTICCIVFLSTLSLRRATLCCWNCTTETTNFYPRSPCGERLILSASSARAEDFYPRSPCGERHSFALFFRFRRGISIHALLAESDGLVLALHRQQEVISIHALLAESDFCLRVYAAVEDISIHALLAESDFRRLDPAHIVTIFLSTLSLRRATSITVASVI